MERKTRSTAAISRRKGETESETFKRIADEHESDDSDDVFKDAEMEEKDVKKVEEEFLKDDKGALVLDDQYCPIRLDGRSVPVDAWTRLPNGALALDGRGNPIERRIDPMDKMTALVEAVLTKIQPPATPGSTEQRQNRDRLPSTELSSGHAAKPMQMAIHNIPAINKNSSPLEMDNWAEAVCIAAAAARLENESERGATAQIVNLIPRDVIQQIKPVLDVTRRDLYKRYPERDYEKFLYEIVKAMRRNTSRSTMEQTLWNRTQREGETIEEYTAELERLVSFTAVYTAWSPEHRDCRDQSRDQVLRMCLERGLRRQDFLVDVAKAGDDLEYPELKDLLIRCQQADEVKKKKTGLKVNEVVAEEAEVHATSAYKKGKKPPQGQGGRKSKYTREEDWMKSQTCFNCEKVGHIQFFCPTKKPPHKKNPWQK